MIIREQYINKITPYIDKPIIKVITGMRRIGKSTFLQMLESKLASNNNATTLNINKESLDFDFIKNYQDLNTYVLNTFGNTAGQKYLFIDEIQEIEDWEKAVSSFLVNETADIYITGSNAHLLSSEISTLISGRYIEFNMLPLTFTEFLAFRGLEINSVSATQEFNNYLKYGGLPGIHLFEFNDAIIFQYLNSILNTILLKDVVAKNNIRDVGNLERITRFVFDNCGNITTAKRIADFMKAQNLRITMETVQNYLHFLQEAFFINKVPRYDIKGKKLLEYYDKYYCGDIGLRNGFIGYKDHDLSGLLENVVYLELLSRGYQVYIGKQDDVEVDFIAQRTNEKIYIQVCYLLADANTVKREFRSLELINDNYPKYVISMDNLFVSDREGIRWMNLLGFLLDK